MSGSAGSPPDRLFSASLQNLRLYDACHLLEVVSPTPVGALPEHLRFYGWNTHPVVYVADEMADAFLSEVVELVKRPDSDRDDKWGCLAPPHDVFMVEARFTVDALAAAGLWNPPHVLPAARDLGWVALGSSTSALRLRDAHRWSPETRQFVDSYRTYVASKGRWFDPEWLFSSRTICWVPQVYDRPVGWVSAHLTQVDSAGFELMTQTQTLATHLVPSGVVSSPRDEEVVFYSGLGVVAQALCFRVLEFLSAQNVEEVPHRGLMPRQMRRSLDRRDGLKYLPQFRTLRVSHGRRVWDLTTMGGVGRPASPADAVALVRGHFKTYSEEAPLFGRHVGTWYWPPHLRHLSDDTA